MRGSTWRWVIPLCPQQVKAPQVPCTPERNMVDIGPRAMYAAHKPTPDHPTTLALRTTQTCNQGPSAAYTNKQHD